jgi:8-oxo-dGTP diphosphatase
VPGQERGPVRAGLVPWQRDDGGRLLVGLVRDGPGPSLPSRDVDGRHPLAAALAATPVPARLGPPGPRAEVGPATSPGGWFWPVEVLAGRESLDWHPAATVAGVADAQGQEVLAAAGQLAAVRQVVLVRHAHAGQRSTWDGPDAERPLDEWGRDQAVALAGLLTAYAVERIHSSDSRRCLETVEPLGAALRLPVLAESLLSEDGSAEDPVGAGGVVADLVSRPGQAVLCTQRKTMNRVLPGLLRGLGIEPDGVESPPKGGLLVLHLPRDSGGTATVEALSPPPV